MFNLPAFGEGSWTWFALDVVAKATILVTLATVVVWSARGASAALKHRVWALALLAIVLLPLANQALPKWSWEIVPRRLPSVLAAEASREPARQLATPAPPVVRSSQPAAEATGADAAVAVEMAAPAEPIAASEWQPMAKAAVPGASLGNFEPVAGQQNGSARIFWIWLAVSLATLVPLVSGLVGNLLIQARSRKLADSDWQRLVADLSDRLGLERPVTLLVGGPRQMPMTFGWLRPCVMLPADALAWPLERRQMVLMHELAHVKRYDVPWQMVARLACAMYWFHPLVWLAARQMRAAREHACDDCVLAAGEKPSSYASQLLDIARTHAANSPLATAALSMARQSQLEGRLLAVLDPRRSRRPVRRAWSAGLLATVLCVALALGMIRPALEAAEPLVASVTPQAAAAAPSGTRVAGTVLSPLGKPLANAKVEVLVVDQRRTMWSRHSTPIILERVQTDAQGNFECLLPERLKGRPYWISLLAGAEGFSPATTLFQLGSSWPGQMKLAESKTVRIQLIDAVGNPIAGVRPMFTGSNGVSLQATAYRQGRVYPETWPQCSESGADGYFTLTVPKDSTGLGLDIDDPKYGAHRLELKLEDDRASAVLKPARFLNGKVVASKNGQPIEGASVVMLEEPYREVHTAADGTFRLAGGTSLSRLFGDRESILQIYPPADSPYLFHTIEWTWPDADKGDAQLTIKLVEGIMLEGTVTEKGTGAPIAGAALCFEPQEYNNLLYRRGSKCRFTGSDMKYLTDERGKFRMPIWPGPGHVIVEAPSTDYVYQEISMGDTYYGKPGLQRQYYHATRRMNVRPGSTAEPVTIELDRGARLHRQVVRPDGSPAAGKAYSKAQVNINHQVEGFLPEINLAPGGVLEIRAYDPERSQPLFLIDFDGHCGLTAAPKANELGADAPPLQLQPCGSVKIRFTTNDAEPLADYEPWLMLVFTPGSTATHHIEANQPLWVDSVIWQNVTRPNKSPKTDAEGRVTIGDLIPGATYMVQYIKDNNWFQGHEFTVRSGETVDLGEISILKKNQ